jgi:superfamily I DNA/RNA helicase
MDKRVVFAVAGAGKTTHIVSQLDESSRALIVTYTNNNLYNLKKKIADKFGYIPDGIRVISYFTFVDSFCYRPFLLHQLKTTGILYEPNKNTLARKANDNYYISPSRRLYSNRIALLIQERQLLDEVRQRLSKYYDLFIVDEVQDISGHDFNLLLEVAKADIQTLFVGDFYQYTYATSSDGNVNKTLHDDFDKYKERFTKAGLMIDETLLRAC